MLTLAGLVGSFFNIQLSQWLRDLFALQQKAFLNSGGSNMDRQRAIFECRIEFKKLTNIQTYLINWLVLSFVIFVLVDGILMIRSAKADPLYIYVSIALWVFLIFFAAVSGWLIYNGWSVARAIGLIIQPKQPVKAKP
jgi:hypothetical protein